MKLPESPHLRLFLRRLALGIGLAVLFTWLALRQPQGEDARLLHEEFLAMGTIVSISLYLGEDQDRADALMALDRARDELMAYAQRWSAWGDGELGRLNQRLAEGERVSIPAALQPLFAQAAQLTHASGGLFDVRIGRLVEIWGFHDEAHYRSTSPDPATLDAAVAALAQAPMLDAAPLAYGPAPAVRFDFGAIAKGDAADRIVASLRAAGYANVIVNAGGNLRAAGRRGARAWRIGVRHPRPNREQRVLATLNIDGDEAVITSGDYERYFEADGRRYHHLLDPRSGQPARGLQAVTVVAPSGALADAASTAIFVAGPQRWRETASALGVDQVFVVDADGRIEVTTALAPRIRFADDAAVTTVR
ncbi:FAD:protein FMN transferase [Sinimarinibacterium thermocellulolyticum]|uniref:FAD:protein FMN transferase n=1 Tax=Sinimarinibacterium thermocellulolyticum TaxID=3170016 RepID=A0ABV2A9U4_9GAMM